MTSPRVFRSIVGFIAVLSLMLSACGEDSPSKVESANTAPKKAAAPKPKTSDDPWDLAGKTPAKTRKTQEANTKKEPRSLDLSKVEEHRGSLFLDGKLETELDAIVAAVADHKTRGVDIASEFKTRLAALTKAIATRESDPFYRDAGYELMKYNGALKKTEGHLRDSNGKLFDTVFAGFALPPYAIFVQRNSEGGERKIAETTAHQLNELRKAFLERFQKVLDLKENPKSRLIKVMLFRDWTDYQAYNRHKEPDRDRTMVAAHYEPGARMLVVPLKYRGEENAEDPDHYLRSVMFHEGTHQLLSAYADQKHLSSYGSMWSDEGLAEHFGGHRVEGDSGDSFKFFLVNDVRARSIAAWGKGRDNRLPLRQVLKWTRFIQRDEEKKNPMKSAMWTSQVYAQGWALVHFMNHELGGKYREIFDKMMQAQLDGDTGLPVFMSAFPGDSFDVFEEEFHQFLDKIVDTVKDRRLKNGELLPAK